MPTRPIERQEITLASALKSSSDNRTVNAVPLALDQVALGYKKLIKAAGQVGRAWRT
jgi:hypothetical protein